MASIRFRVDASGAKAGVVSIVLWKSSVSGACARATRANRALGPHTEPEGPRGPMVPFWGGFGNHFGSQQAPNGL